MAAKKRMKTRLKAVLKQAERSIRNVRDRLLRKKPEPTHDEDAKFQDAKLRAVEQSFARQIDVLQDQLNRLQQAVARHSKSFEWAACHPAFQPATQELDAASGPLVSIVMAVRNGASTIGKAIGSILSQTYPRWELLIVDNSSTDTTEEAVRPFLHDQRIRLLYEQRTGSSSARNRGLREARGEILTYLDADNEWFPGYLAQVVHTYRAAPEASCVYLAQLVQDEQTSLQYVRGQPFSAKAIAEENFIDLNIFSHRRECWEEWGGFDESLTRLSDWDLILRYSREHDPFYVPAVGGIYRQNRPGSVTATAPLWRNAYRIARKQQSPIREPLRVLYALEEFPQRSEAYIRWELECMQRWGVQIEVWSRQKQPGSPYPTDVRVHRGSLEEALSEFRPHLVHSHWLHVGAQIASTVAKFGRTMTVRGHSFEHVESHLAAAHDHAAVERLYLFPHFAQDVAAKKVQPLSVTLNGELYYPESKDPRLVLRTGAGLPYKDLLTYIDVAAKCPDFCFVLAVATVITHEAFLDELEEYNRKLGSPVEIWRDVPAEELAATVRRAGIYMHTHAPDRHRYGMPISVAEAMASGCYIIARHCDDSVAYIGDRGGFYHNADEAAALIQETRRWQLPKWHEMQKANSEHAYQQFGDVFVLRPVLDRWREIARRRPLFFQSNANPLPDRFVQFLEGCVQGTELEHHGFLTHLFGTCYGIMNAGYREALWKAGLFHSLYGTTRTKSIHYPLKRRGEMAELLGAEAERLVYLFCAMDILAFYREIQRRDRVLEIRDRLANRVLSITPKEFEDLCVMHLFEAMEKWTRGVAFGPLPAFRTMAQMLGGPAQEVYDTVLACAENPVMNQRTAA